jgi:hypothetical protein
MSPDSIATYRDGWETILDKLRAGEMPPKGIPRPPEAQMQALVHYVEGEFEKADRNIKPDPGHVTARRLNRSEYSNTIRDLLAVDFRAEKDFPTDDSGYGFDNIADVLTISPVLMERYMDAAEIIASRAMGADPLPKKPLEAQYHTKDKTIRRGPEHHRSVAPRRMGWRLRRPLRHARRAHRRRQARHAGLLDGRHADEDDAGRNQAVEAGLLRSLFGSRSALYLPSGDHVFRAAFIDDDFVKTLSEKDAYNNKKNKF